MVKAWGNCDNDKYKVRCNGHTVWVYSAETEELITRFRGFPYTYVAKFKPGTNDIVVKSSDGYLGFYDLDKRILLKKIRFGGDSGQDEGFAFSTDGKWLYNIEDIDPHPMQLLTRYDTTSFKSEVILELDRRYGTLTNIEITETGDIYLLFVDCVCMLNNNSIERMHPISLSTYHTFSKYLDWKDTGFSEKAARWILKEKEKKLFQEKTFSLEELFMSQEASNSIFE